MGLKFPTEFVLLHETECFILFSKYINYNNMKKSSGHYHKKVPVGLRKWLKFEK